ncbi:uncharacterized protein LOC111519868 [Drosophila willistoni]|uniref:uncharacterized protein LOC111519868 n=1 Tax=Drosophila willistoni TaxID=7260 RepID=UPI000C26C82F|nr:uncharacterized protein LOC111519868 [Drosophila willistoni]
MEKDTVIKEEQATIEAISTMANKVLTIGGDDSEVDDRIKDPVPGKHYESNFDEEFKERLIKIMLPGTQPLPEKNDTNLIEQFSARRIEKNGKIIYQFDCKDFGGGSQSRTKHEPGWTTISGPAYSAKFVLDLVRERLKDELWIRDNVVECRTKETKEYCYMQGIVSECLDKANEDFYNYVLCLQQQFRYGTELIQK